MGFWKVLGGIAAGVGAVALLPVAGAVGAVTVTGALVGGAVGAAVAVGTDDEDEKKRLRNESQRAAAKCAATTSKAKEMVAESQKKVATAQKRAKEAELRASEAEASLRDAADMMERYRESLKDVEAHYQLIIALTAIGMAAANADGSVDECETGELDEYISGITAAKLPAKVKARIQYLHNHPPTFEKAVAEVVKLDRKGLPLDAFRTLIVDVIHADGVVDEGEKAFLEGWDRMVENGLVLVKKSAAKKTPVKRTARKTVAVRKAPAKKTAAKKTVARKTPVKKALSRK